MDNAIRKQIIDLLDEHRIMSLATLRPDGWPQATTVGYAHEGLNIYFLCGLDSQKTANLTKDNRVSMTIDHDSDQVMEIKGLSIAAHARRITDETEANRVLAMIIARYSKQKGFDMAIPKTSEMALFELKPVVISVLDYSKGFAHTDLVRCSDA